MEEDKKINNIKKVALECFDKCTNIVLPQDYEDCNDYIVDYMLAAASSISSAMILHIMSITDASEDSLLSLLEIGVKNQIKSAIAKSRGKRKCAPPFAGTADENIDWMDRN